MLGVDGTTLTYIVDEDILQYTLNCVQNTLSMCTLSGLCAKNGMSRRYSKHKSDLRAKNCSACGLAKHFGHHNQAEMEEAISRLEVTLLVPSMR